MPGAFGMLESFLKVSWSLLSWLPGLYPARHFHYFCKIFGMYKHAVAYRYTMPGPAVLANCYKHLLFFTLIFNCDFHDFHPLMLFMVPAFWPAGWRWWLAV